MNLHGFHNLSTGFLKRGTPTACGLRAGPKNMAMIDAYVSCPTCKKKGYILPRFSKWGCCPDGAANILLDIQARTVGMRLNDMRMITLALTPINCCPWCKVDTTIPDHILVRITPPKKERSRKR